jgi:ribosome-associated protein
MPVRYNTVNPAMTSFIPIAPGIAFDPRELVESFVRASGPGGQNVNKVSTSVQVRLDLRRPGSLPESVRERAERLGGGRVTTDGVLIITAQRFRSQDRNRQDALERVVALLRQAAVRPVIRRETKPTAGSRRRRVEAKTQRGAIKRLRRVPGDE